MPPFALVVAATQKGGIGYQGKLPWPHLSDDLKFFRQLTRGGTVIMGRKTYQELGQPLPDRQNIVVSATLDAKTDGVIVVPSLAAGHAAATSNQVFVIGGARLYAEAMEHPLATKIYLTQVLEDFPADTFIPPIPSNYTLSKVGKAQMAVISSNQMVCFQFLEYERRPDECQYLDMVKTVLTTGSRKMDRTGTGTLSKFGFMCRYNLREGVLPLLTTKRVYWKGVVEELLWMISGCTDANVLSAKGVTIWDANGTREFLDKQGLKEHKVGDLGPVYGFQWRHFGAAYRGSDLSMDRKDGGIDQLADVIQQIKTNPTSRRVVMSAWNPVDLKKMALPPCHVLSQFAVDNGELSCILYQRSGDVGLGVPFNIASYSLLTIMIAHLTGLKPGEFIHMLGDTHVYLNHVEPLKEQLKRTPTAPPKLHIKRTVTSIDDFKADDFELIDYHPQASISMTMSA